MRFIVYFLLSLLFLYLVGSYGNLGKDRNGILEDRCDLNMYQGFCYLSLKSGHSDCVKLIYIEEECDKLVNKDIECWAIKQDGDCDVYLDKLEVETLRYRLMREDLYRFLIVSFIFIVMIMSLQRYRYFEKRIKRDYNWIFFLVEV